MENRSFKIITLGCKVNHYESQCISSRLLKRGWKEAINIEEAQIIIINTCIVTQKASHQSRQAIRRAIRGKRRGALVIAIGCYAQVYGQELEGIEGLDLVLGNEYKDILDEILDGGRLKDPNRYSKVGFSTNWSCPVEGFNVKSRAFLKIQDGCDSFCSYCIVPYARGPIRSLSPEKVIEMLRRFSGAGFKEVVLTGVHLGRYGRDMIGDWTLLRLLKRIKRENLPLRIRLSSLELTEIQDELIEMILNEPWLCRHLHIPLQSGDDEILKRMNRSYSSSYFREKIQYITYRIPDISIGVDVMVGFPGEDENAFKNTFNLLKELPISYLHVFIYSDRKGTEAFHMDGKIPYEIQHHRSQILLKLSKEKRLGFLRSCLNKEFNVVVEQESKKFPGFLEGVTDNYIRVIFKREKGLLRKMLLKVKTLKIRDEKYVFSRRR